MYIISVVSCTGSDEAAAEEEGERKTTRFGSQGRELLVSSLFPKLTSLVPLYSDTLEQSDAYARGNLRHQVNHSRTEQ